MIFDEASMFENHSMPARRSDDPSRLPPASHRAMLPPSTDTITMPVADDGTAEDTARP